MATQTTLPFGYEYTVGNQIVSASGTPIRIDAINWFGLETGAFAPGGLDTQSYKVMMNQMLSLGFNTIRLPFSLQALSPNSFPTGINTTLNPDLKGVDALSVMDAIIAYAGQIGMKVILDNHRSSAYSGPNGNGLWVDDGYTTGQWVDDLTSLAQRYAGNSTVTGIDLANEPHGPAVWGGGGVNDWAQAATAAANSIQTVNPNLLMIVQGVQTYNGDSTLWGGNLEGVATNPITLTVPNHVVYEVHEYPPSVTYQPAYSDPSYPQNLPALWTQQWGYIYQQNIAPVFVGEFGSKLQTTTDQQYIATLVSYLDGFQTGSGTVSDIPAGGQGVSWAYWAWNPNSGDTGGILENDWQTVDQTKISAIQSLFAAAVTQPATAQTTTTPMTTMPVTTMPVTTTPVTTTTSPATTTPAATQPAATASATPVITPIDGGMAGNATINLGDGNFAVAISGMNNTVTVGNGNNLIGIGVESPLGNTSIATGTGNNVVIAFGSGDQVTTGAGNNIVIGPQGNAKLALGAGDNVVVLFGASNTIASGDTTNPTDGAQISFINAGSGNEHVSVGDGTVFVLAGGQGDVVTTGTGGTVNSRSFVFLTGGNATVTAGAGTSWTVLSGQNNSFDGGTGTNVVWDGAGSDRFVLHQGGTDYINDYAATGSDRLDLSQALAGAHVTSDIATLSRYIGVSTVSNNTVVQIDPTGHGSFTANPLAVLVGQSGLTLASLSQQAAFILPNG